MRLRINRGTLRLAALVALGLGLLAAAAAGGYFYALDSTATKYDTTFVVTADIVRKVNRQGRAVAARETVMRSGVGGTVTGVLVAAGDAVKAGDVLVRLSNPAAQIAADQAKVSLDLARLKLEDLFSQAGAMQVTATVAGRVASLRARVGDTVTRGATAAVIEEPSVLTVEVRVPEHAATVVRPGLGAKVTIPTVAGAWAAGWVTEVGGSLQGSPGSATVPVYVAFKNPGGIVPGMTASVSLSLEGVRLPVTGKVGGEPGEVLTSSDRATVVKVMAVAGQEVEAGQVLIELDSPDLRVKRDQAKLAYRSAEDRYNTYVSWYDEYDSVHVSFRLQYLNAKQTYEALEAAVARLNVTSPCRGRVVSVAVREGETVEAGVAVAQVVPVDSLVVRALVPGARLGTLTMGQRLMVDLPESGRTGLAGTLTGISPQTSGLAADGRFEITVEVRAEATSWPGATARIILPEGPDTVEASGSVSSESQEYVRFGAAGTVGAVMISEGAMVAGGDVLFVLVNEALIAEGTPVSGPGLSRDELTSRAGTSLREEILRTRSAELTYEQRRLEAVGLTFRAEHDGMVAEVKVRTGDVVAPGGQVVSIIDTSAVDIVTDVGELDVGKLQPGMEMDVYFPAYSQETFVGQLIEIGYTPTRGQEGSTYPLLFRLDGAAGVLPGMSCTVSITTDVRADVLAIPVEAVQQRFGAPAVRVVRDKRQEASQIFTAIQKAGRTYKGDVEWVYIITGVSDGARVEVIRGLPLYTEIVVREKERTRCPFCDQPVGK